mgnify:CR=1 FL=1
MRYLYPIGLDKGGLIAPIAEDQWIESHHLGKVSQKLLLVFYDAQLIFISFSTSRSILKDCEEYQNVFMLGNPLIKILRFGFTCLFLFRKGINQHLLNIFIFAK